MWENAAMQPWVDKAVVSVRHEWREAPWFVVLVLAVAAFVGPGLLLGLWVGLRGLF